MQIINFTYLIINILSSIIPLLFSFDSRLKIRDFFPELFKSIFFVAIVFIAWDIYFTEIEVWGFTDKYLTGLKIFNLPIEEILFFICIPYACTFTYEVVKYFLQEKYESFLMKLEKQNFNLIQIINNLLIATSLILFIYTVGRYYSSWTFLAFSLTIILLYRERFLPLFYLSCLFIFPGFFLVNGILTGICFNIPVVWYNDLENIALRFFSIPYEDFFYGFVLLVWNVKLYLKFKKVEI